MEFWILWVIGIVITIVTRVLLESDSWYNVEEFDRVKRIIVTVLAIISIILVGGIANGLWLGLFAREDIGIGGYIIAGIIPAIMTYFVGSFILGLDHFTSEITHVIFIVFFIISIIGWSVVITDYNRNIDVITETVLTSTEERNLLYFCSIPVQDISENNSDSSTYGTIDVSENITATDELSYWYSNGEDEGLYDSVKSKNSKIVFITEKQQPCVTIDSYKTTTSTINNNNGKKDEVTNKEWKEYTFHLPREILNYQLK